VAEVFRLDELFVFLWGWLRFPVALSLFGADVNAPVYHAVSDSIKVVELPGNLDNETINSGRLKDV